VSAAASTPVAPASVSELDTTVTDVLEMDADDFWPSRRLLSMASGGPARPDRNEWRHPEKMPSYYNRRARDEVLRVLLVTDIRCSLSNIHQLAELLAHRREYVDMIWVAGNLTVLREEDRANPAKFASSEGEMSAVISALENIQCRVVYVPGETDPESTYPREADLVPPRLTPHSCNLHARCLRLAPDLVIAGLAGPVSQWGALPPPCSRDRHCERTLSRIRTCGTGEAQWERLAEMINPSVAQLPQEAAPAWPLAPPAAPDRVLPGDAVVLLSYAGVPSVSVGKTDYGRADYGRAERAEMHDAKASAHATDASAGGASLREGAAAHGAGRGHYEPPQEGGRETQSMQMDRGASTSRELEEVLRAERQLDSHVVMLANSPAADCSAHGDPALLGAHGDCALATTPCHRFARRASRETMTARRLGAQAGWETRWSSRRRRLSAGASLS
jgi:hypothetical protein